MGSCACVSAPTEHDLPAISQQNVEFVNRSQPTSYMKTIQSNLQELLKQEQDECKSVEDCVPIARLLNRLKYYSSLDINNNISSGDCGGNLAEVFEKLLFSKLLDDYAHVLIKHHNIALNIIQCDSKEKLENCKFTLRHHEPKNTDNNSKSDPKLNFYRQTMDSLHFYLCHLYDYGLRTTKNHNIYDEHCFDEYFDQIFCRINKSIQCTKPLTASVERFKSNKNYKFNVIANHATYLDQMYEHLSNVAIGDDNHDINKLKKFVCQQDFDSESINAYFDDDSSKISKYIKNTHIVEISHFIKAMSMSSSSFNIGLRFYYWPYYQSPKNTSDEKHRGWNENDHSGYKISELCVEQKYKSFKEEIRHYKNINFQKEYQTEIITKVNNYRNTDIVKRISADNSACDRLHYYAAVDTVLGCDNLISLILYTDYSDLSRDFSSSFRKQNPFETLTSIKIRNREYWWMSKILRETVEIFGDQTPGPFYCGMSEVMNMPSFNIRLCSPTSTTMHIEVAMKFSGDNGLIIQFNNPLSMQHCNLTSFNCSWLSRYKEEDERLFFGGEYSIKIESIILRDTKQNFEKIMSALYYLDTMLSGGDISKNMKITPKGIELISDLINNVLGKAINKKYDNYVYSTFHCFIESKRQIVLNLHELKNVNGALRDLLMYKVKQCDHNKDYSNLFRFDLFAIFKNVKTIILYTNDCQGMYSYPISLPKLFSLIDSTCLQNVIIKAIRKTNANNSWLSTLWSQEKKSLCDSEEKLPQTEFSEGTIFDMFCSLPLTPAKSEYARKDGIISFNYYQFKGIQTLNNGEDWLQFNKKRTILQISK